MEFGYSILLGELLPASELGYKDCRTLQVVCAACHEPIFKVHREAGIRSGCDYFAHYDRKLSVGVDCEARVSAKIGGKDRQDPVVARNQRLRYFLSVMPTAISRAPVFADGGLKSVKSIVKGKGYQLFRSYVIRQIRVLATPQFRDQLFERFAEVFDETIIEAGEDLPIVVRLRIARELLELLLTPSASEGMANVVDLAMYEKAMVSRSIAVEQKGDEEWMDCQMQYDVYREASKLSRRKAQSFINNLETRLTPIQLAVEKEDGSFPTWSDHFVYRSMAHLALVILQLPYIAILRDKYGDPSVERAYIKVLEVAHETPTLQPYVNGEHPENATMSEVQTH